MRVVHGGVQYREYLSEEQRSQPGAPTARTVRRGVERGCSAGRMQLEFHRGLLGPGKREGRKENRNKRKREG